MIALSVSVLNPTPREKKNHEIEKYWRATRNKLFHLYAMCVSPILLEEERARRRNKKLQNETK